MNRIRLNNPVTRYITTYLNFLSSSNFLLYTVTPLIPLLIVAVLSTDSYLWVGSEIHHFYIELFAVILSAVLGFYYILHARNLNDRFSLFVGIGFSVSAALDLFHVVVSYSMMEDVNFLKYFIPQTWFAGRIFLSCMLLIGVAKYSSLLSEDRWVTRNKEALVKGIPSKKRGQKMVRQAKFHGILQDNLLINLTFLTGLASILAFTSLYIIYPASVLDNYSLHRPYEIPPLILFLVTLFFFYKKKLYLKKDVIYKGIHIYLIVEIFTQIIMSYSAAPFDTSHNMAHVLKDVGYFVNIIALALSGIQYTVILKERNQIIKNQYEKISESEKVKDEFINIAAHELRTPIQPILALSIFLYGQNGALENYREHIEIIIKNSKRLQKLAEEILDAAKIESHSLTLDPERFDLLLVIHNLIRDLGSQIRNDNNDVIIRFFYDGKKVEEKGLNENDGGDALYIHADKNRITRVLSNILSNSIKFTTHGEIDILVQNVKNHLSVKIKDSGPGIDKAILPKLFDKFITGSPSGTGLGLYICKYIIKAHGGNIWAENNPSNAGATFTFTLPLNKDG